MSSTEIRNTISGRPVGSTLRTVIGPAFVFVLLSSLVLAGPDGSSDAGRTPVLTNDDLPRLSFHLDTEPAKGGESPLSSVSPRVPIGALATAAPAIVFRQERDAEPTPEELLEELQRQRRREMRLLVPFFSRRFAVANAEERASEQGRAGRERLERVRDQIDELRVDLVERGVEIPGRVFGQEGPQFVDDITEGPQDVPGVAAGEPYPEETVSRSEGRVEARTRLFRPLEEIDESSVLRGYGDARPGSSFAAILGFAPVVLPQ